MWEILGHEITTEQKQLKQKQKQVPRRPARCQKARHVSDIWIVYQPRREAGGRKVVFGSRNREVGWVSFPV